MHRRYRASLIAAFALCLPFPLPASALTTQAEWHTAIRQQLQRKIEAPPQIREANADLNVQVRIVVLPSGVIDTVTLARSSGNVAVDNATLAMIRRGGKLPAFTPDMAPDKQIVMLPVRYVVEKSDIAPPPAPPPLVKQTRKNAPD
ncbi:MAG: energy transducer TonB family protein [Achromobacter sp.]